MAATNLPTQLPRWCAFNHNLNDQTLPSSTCCSPSTLQLCRLLQTGQVFSEEDRASSLIALMCSLLREFDTTGHFKRDLVKYVNTQLAILNGSRVHTLPMENIIKFFKLVLSEEPGNNKEMAKNVILKLQGYLLQKLLLAKDKIAAYFLRERVIKNGDVVMIFGGSSVVRDVLNSVAEFMSRMGETFEIVIVCSRPLCDDKKSLTTLFGKVKCSYIPLSGAAAFMSIKAVSRVIFGASAILSNGSMLGPAGCAVLASLAKYNKITSMVLIEKYKLCERVLFDAVVFNELGDQLELVSADSSSLPSSDPYSPVLYPSYRGPAKFPRSISEAGTIFSGGNLSTRQAESVLIPSVSRKKTVDTTTESASAEEDKPKQSKVKKLVTVVEGGEIALSRSSSDSRGLSSDHKKKIASLQPTLDPVEESRIRNSRSADPTSILHYQVLNLRYDLTPSEKINEIVTEDGLLLPESVSEALDQELKFSIETH